MSLQLPDSLGWNARRPLHLLGVPFSYLKEQVDEEVPTTSPTDLPLSLPSLLATGLAPKYLLPQPWVGGCL